MAPRAMWKGYIKLAALAFPAALFAGTTTAKRISFHIINRKTGNRVHRQMYDEQTEKPVEREHQAKGYETEEGDHIVIGADEVADAVPESDKTINIESFIVCPDVDPIYFDKPYYLGPPSGVLGESFSVVREGMRRKNVAAVGRAVLFRRVRTLLLRAVGPGLMAHTLNFDYEVRAADEVFEGLPELKVEGEMLDLAKHIIDTKSGEFDPRQFDDRYDEALAELIKAKMEGRQIKAPKAPRETKVVSLMDALRESAKAAKKPKKAARNRGGTQPQKRRKAS